jgi:tRNA pseudouridine13 synthase
VERAFDIRLLRSYTGDETYGAWQHYAFQMKYKVQPEDFVVEERIHLRFTPGGDFSVYRVRKRGTTTLSVQAQMARTLGVAQSDIVFPALKDKDAVAVQHAAVHGIGSTRVTGTGFTARLLGRIPRPLAPSDIFANRFTLVLRDLPAEEVASIRERSAVLEQSGLPNYFDEQRFGSYVSGKDHIGKRILQRDAEGALRAYLTQPFAGDPKPVRAFKVLAADHWGDWDVLFEAAPRPSNFRSVLTYLRDHPEEYRKALNLITQRLLSIYLSAYQSLLWNRVAGRYLEAQLGAAPAYIEVVGERLPVYRSLPLAVDREIGIPLPNHRASYNPKMAEVVAQVLDEEGLKLNDLKARILKRAYLSKGRRALFLFPEDVSISEPGPDERFPDRQRMTASFALPRGSYATMVLKTLVA